MASLAELVVPGQATRRLSGPFRIITKVRRGRVALETVRQSARYLNVTALGPIHGSAGSKTIRARLVLDRACEIGVLRNRGPGTQ